MSEYYNEYLHSEQWRTVSAIRRKMDGYKCACCGDENNLNVHHLFYPRNIYETEPEGLVTLCKNCHVLVHRIQEAIDKFSYTVTKNGYIDHSCSTYDAIRFEVSRIIVVELWRRSLFKTTDVSAFLNAIKPIYNCKRAIYSTDMILIMKLLAMVKDCYIANQPPKYAMGNRKYKRLSKTRYK